MYLEAATFAQIFPLKQIGLRSILGNTFWKYVTGAAIHTAKAVLDLGKPLLDDIYVQLGGSGLARHVIDYLCERTLGETWHDIGIDVDCLAAYIG